MTAARRYKEIVDGVAGAFDELAARDAEKAGELARLLVGLDQEMAQAQERAALTRFVVDLHWEAALEALWAEHWLALAPLPRPDPARAHGDPATLDEAVAARLEDLRAATRRRGFGIRRR